VDTKTRIKSEEYLIIIYGLQGCENEKNKDVLTVSVSINLGINVTWECTQNVLSMILQSNIIIIFYS
jgi:hypothetical protein